jgi:hypothetical protein
MDLLGVLFVLFFMFTIKVSLEVNCPKWLTWLIVSIGFAGLCLIIASIIVTASN